MARPTLDAGPSLADADYSTLPPLEPPVEHLPAHVGGDSIHTPIPAMRVQVRRHMPRVRAEVRENARTMGHRYVYSWEVKDRRGGRPQTISGGTIKLAQMIARVYGNCRVGAYLERETATHFHYVGMFIDLETGYSLARPFLQRREQNIGMRDAGRAEDLVFQIGASKAMRNVILNALSDLADFAIEEARHSMPEWVAANRERALTLIEQMAEEVDVAQVRLEGSVGRKRNEWTNIDIAKLMLRLRAIVDGADTVESVFPTADHAAGIIGEREEAREATSAEAHAARATRRAKAKPAATMPPPADAAPPPAAQVVNEPPPPADAAPPEPDVAGWPSQDDDAPPEAVAPEPVRAAPPPAPAPAAPAARRPGARSFFGDQA